MSVIYALIAVVLAVTSIGNEHIRDALRPADDRFDVYGTDDDGADFDDADPDLVDRVQSAEKKAQRKAVRLELEAWWALPAAVNR
jgi:hypothetical protein